MLIENPSVIQLCSAKIKDDNLHINILYFRHECFQAIHPILVGFLNRWIAINQHPVNHESFLTVKMSKKHLQTITKIDRENNKNVTNMICKERIAVET